jgi:predicted AAA+ superfamily ATPase
MRNKRKAISKSKFYFFDLGVVNSLLERKTVSQKTPEFGGLFETLVFLELKSYKEYRKKDETIHFWRTQKGDEVDFVIGDSVAIEVKATQMAKEQHLIGLKSLNQDISLKKKIVVSQDNQERKLGDVSILPYSAFVERLWNGDFF